MTAPQLFAALTRKEKLAVARNDSRVKDLLFGPTRDRYAATTINDCISLCENYARKKG